MGFGIIAGVWIVHHCRRKRLMAATACVVIIGVNILLTWLDSLAHSTHRLALAAELSNAVDLLEAARVTVQVDDSREVTSPAHETAFALALREGTTNVLRHSQADQVCITITDESLSIRNNGAVRGDEPTLRGLATLQQRIADDGGVLSVHQEDGTFTVTVSFVKETV